jgi:uncharacterized LabA/DUF88 family protein
MANNNYAFIDSQNLNLATQNLGWNLDWAKFRAYLRDNFHVETAYLFIGYMPEHQDIYSALQKSGYIVIFKPVTISREGEVKGNVDAEMVLQAMIDLNKYDKAVIVTGDGDFASLVSHLVSKDKLESVIIPNQRQHSQMLRQAAKDHVSYLNELRTQLQYRKYGNQESRNRNQGSTKPETTSPTKTSPPAAVAKPAEAPQPTQAAIQPQTTPEVMPMPAPQPKPAILTSAPQQCRRQSDEYAK